MNLEESLSMRHPNRLSTRPGGKSPRVELMPAGKRAEQHRSRRVQQPAHAVLNEPHRKWMRNFSLHSGPPLWLLLKQG